jgi:hypothetical protein
VTVKNAKKVVTAKKAMSATKTKGGTVPIDPNTSNVPIAPNDNQKPDDNILQNLKINGNHIDLINKFVKIMMVIEEQNDEQKVSLNGFYKEKMGPGKARCVLKALLIEVVLKNIITNKHTLYVQSPTTKDGKTEEDTVKMYEKMGFIYGTP